MKEVKVSADLTMSKEEKKKLRGRERAKRFRASHKLDPKTGIESKFASITAKIRDQNSRQSVTDC